MSSPVVRFYLWITAVVVLGIAAVVLAAVMHPQPIIVAEVSEGPAINVPDDDFDRGIAYSYLFADHQALIDWCRQNNQSAVCLDDKAWKFQVPCGDTTSPYGFSVVGELMRQKIAYQFAKVAIWPSGSGSYDVAILLEGSFDLRLPDSVFARLFEDHGDESHQSEILPIEKGRTTAVTTCWPEDDQLIVRSFPFALGGNRLSAFYDRYYSADCDSLFPPKS